MSTSSTRAVRAGRRTVDIHRPDKVLFPGDGITKADLAGYYHSIAPFMLPQLRGRPLMLERHPDGIDGPRFMQKDTPAGYPDWVHRVTVPKEGGTVTHTVCDDTATLLHLADQACVTLHRWQSRAGRPDHPDRMVFDLDPPADDFAAVRRAAHHLGELLDALGLPSALMTTGSRGLHVIVPLDGHSTFDDVRAFARDVADTLAAAHPDELTTAARKQARGDRLYLDIQRNGYAQTAVAPYSVRARPGAPVATPLRWDQLDDPATHARRWTVTTVADQARSTPWDGSKLRPRALGPARRRLDALR
ncbi:ATP-dependent DNA ligase [Streptomyces sp. WAC05374]|uniref:non-homologous end-joining DNA ligase n=1 Tax=Streptomyces sp. WAC05374 TaxID=2487420 RepID=UPI000F86946B|nr:non-homologous end-joining DNA ligase [Streptomyces sp. WAC05374]RST15840.1 ATP-dependent DNA ligase [Streptomyces sp. WAC05374]TDF46076.1 ATP-dependent DNA ligase [Streptomyces sp. WAC05374]TDF53067.1 ATP-dependent DNA ligase [Streptomyces sp. WAC05374]TDF58283.1 ATP-dependent DNA ligase [Streptomyces sp. WAC05374]